MAHYTFTLMRQAAGAHSSGYKVTLVRFEEGSSSPSNRYAALVDENSKDLTDLTAGRAEVIPRDLKIWSADGRRIGSRSAATLFQKADELKEFTDVVLDISSLPRSIFYPLIAKLLYLAEQRQGRDAPLNLLVLVSENSEIDARIMDEGIDEEADYVDLFRSGADRMASSRHPKVWVPIL